MVLTDFLFIDLDSTLIDTKSGKTFPIDKNDWKLKPKVISYVKNLVDRHEYKVVLVTNQAGIAQGHQTLKDTIDKIKDVESSLPWNFKDVFIGKSFACVYRKPRFKTLVKNLEKKGYKISPFSIMIGDAGGRTSDHSDSDRKFAENLGIEFIHVNDIK
jgi:bifunctional polynucleotide phosphatase/kinase